MAANNNTEADIHKATLKHTEPISPTIMLSKNEHTAAVARASAAFLARRRVSRSLGVKCSSTLNSSRASIRFGNLLIILYAVIYCCLFNIPLLYINLAMWGILIQNTCIQCFVSVLYKPGDAKSLYTPVPSYHLLSLNGNRGSANRSQLLKWLSCKIYVYVFSDWHSPYTPIHGIEYPFYEG